MIAKFRYRNQTWFWNPFSGFFFQPVGPGRTKERIVTESSPLYSALYSAAGQP